MTVNEDMNASNNARSRRVRVVFERVTIECEDTCGAFDPSRDSEHNNDNDPEPKAAFEAARLISSSDANPCTDDDRRRSPEYWKIPGTESFVKVCASAEGLGDLEPSDTTPAYAVAKRLHILRILLQQMQHPKSEPVTLEAVDIASAA
jgi:hypothetical protein